MARLTLKLAAFVSKALKPDFKCDCQRKEKPNLSTCLFAVTQFNITTLHVASVSFYFEGDAFDE